MSEFVTQNESTYRNQFFTDFHQTCHQGRVPRNVITAVFGINPNYFCPPYTPKPLFGKNL